jgi:outer membrane protein assembly factor BamB
MKYLINLHFVFVLCFAVQTVVAQDATLNWPSWRGEMHTGAADQADPPVEFDMDTKLKWFVDLPGKGHSTPIVWGDKIIVTTAVATEKKGDRPDSGEEEGRGRRAMSPNQTDFIHQFKVLLLNKQDGSIVWETTVIEEMPQERTHQLGSWASNSPVTDGELIYAYFGSRGLYCLDFSGEIIWSKDWGQLEKHMSFGEGSSPFLYQDKIAVLWDHEGTSLIVVLDKKTGRLIWEKERDEGTSWSTPLVVEVNGKAQLITSATSKIRSYDLETGEELWESTGLTRNVIPNPVYSDGILYLMSGYRGTALQAIDIGKAKGNVVGSEAMLWEYNENTPYTPNPLLMDGRLYFLRNNNGFISCLDAKTGEVKYSSTNIEGIGNLYSSPTGGGGKIYIAADGEVAVIKAGDSYELLAMNTIDDTFHASPVIIGNELFLRGFKGLYCFSND